MVQVYRYNRLTVRNIQVARNKPPLKKYEVKRAIDHIRRELQTAKEELPLYTSKYSRKEFTLHQLYAILSLREELDAGYRTITILLEIYPELKNALGIKSIPHYSTLAYAYKRLPNKKKLCRYWVSFQPLERD
jgi:hypothetical protein